MHWTYNHTTLSYPPEGAEGFVYIITNTYNNKIYIGKKSFWSRTTKKIANRKNRKHFTTESNWRDYYSSSTELKKEVKELGPEVFKREVLQICYSKRELTYCEVYWQFKYDVLTIDSYNHNILGKFFKGNLI